MTSFDEEIFEEYRGLLKECMGKGVDAIQRVNKVENGTPDLLILSLYASLLEYINCALVLSAKKISSADDVIFRSFLEGFVDFKNLLRIENYHLNLQVDHDMSWNKVLKAACDGNPFFESIALAEDRDARHLEHRANIDHLLGAGIKKISIKKKFDLAEMTAEYESIYAFSSREVHNSIGALMRRHFEEDGDNYVLKLNHWLPERCSLRFDGYLVFLIEATNLLSEKFDSSLADVMKPISEQLARLRQKVTSADNDT